MARTPKKIHHEIQIYKDAAGEWRSRIIETHSKKIILVHSEGYKRIDDLTSPLYTFMDSVKAGEVPIIILRDEAKPKPEPAPEPLGETMPWKEPGVQVETPAEEPEQEPIEE